MTLPRGEGGPRQRVGRGMRAETGKSVQPYRPTPGPVIVPWSMSSGFGSSNVTARIPLQSPVGSEEPTGDSFSPGEAIWRCAPERRGRRSLRCGRGGVPLRRGGAGIAGAFSGTVDARSLHWSPVG